jgi:hypothetical protein
VGKTTGRIGAILLDIRRSPKSIGHWPTRIAAISVMLGSVLDAGEEGVNSEASAAPGIIVVGGGLEQDWGSRFSA